MEKRLQKLNKQILGLGRRPEKLAPDQPAPFSSQEYRQEVLNG